MFLHLVTDEKFIDGVIARFNHNDPGNHIYVLVHRDPFEGFQFIKQADAVQKVLVGSERYIDFLSKLSSYDAVFLHGLFSPHVIEMVNTAPADTIFVWLFWGGELWSFKSIRNSMMLPRTLRLYRHTAVKYWLGVNIRKYAALLKQGKFRTILANVFRRHAIQSQNKTTNSSISLEKAIRCVNYIIPVISNDIAVIEKHFHLKAKVLDWNYSMGMPLDSLGDIHAGGKNILIGNSASYTNNHLDIFRVIRKFKHWNGRLIVPLSYGDSTYKDCILQAGKKMFGDQFMPLDQFMPVEHYTTILESCSCAFFNTVRQQAMGNIIILLYQGTRVFLREENPVYHFLKQNGITVFPIHSDAAKNIDNIQPLTKTEISQNRSILKFLYNEKTLDEKTRVLLSILRK